MNRIDTNKMSWAEQIIIFKAVCKNYRPGCSNCPNCTYFEIKDPNKKEIIITVKGEVFSGRTFILNKISEFLQSEGFEIKRGRHVFYNTKIQEDDKEHSIVIINEMI